jgi:methyl-accepting chemotaxis protein
MALGGDAVFGAKLGRDEGIVRAGDSFDGRARIWAYRQVKPYGLMVLTSSALDDVLVPWWQRSIQTLLAALAVTALVAWLVRGLYRRMRTQSQLVSALQHTTTRLHQVVETMMQGSGKVAHAGEVMSVSAQQLAIRTDQQGSQLLSTGGEVRQAVQQVQHSTGHVVAVEGQCDQLRQQTHQGLAVVTRSVKAIEDIASQARRMNEAVSVIESIAFQTNLLALNAAVEAARAGEAGRSFAVVASEVRELANRSRQAAGEVRERIAEANAKAGQGVQEIALVRQVLDGIAGGVDAVADGMRAVATDAREQSDALQRVLVGLDELAGLTSSNADMVAESVMAAEDMREHAQRLRGTVADIERDLSGQQADLHAGQTAEGPSRTAAAAAGTAAAKAKAPAATAPGAFAAPVPAPSAKATAAPAPAPAANVEFF